MATQGMNMNMNTTIAMIDGLRSGLNVRRYHQYYTAEVDTVGKHSAGVALFCNLIDPKARKEVILAAVSHDLGEYKTGDIPAPVKKLLPEVKAALQEMEGDFISSLGIVVALTPDEYKLLKIADVLDGLCFCMEERLRGNQTIKHVEDTYVSYAHDLLNKIESEDILPHWYAKASVVFLTILSKRKML